MMTSKDINKKILEECDWMVPNLAAIEIKDIECLEKNQADCIEISFEDKINEYDVKENRQKTLYLDKYNASLMVLAMERYNKKLKEKQLEAISSMNRLQKMLYLRKNIVGADIGIAYISVKKFNN